MLMLEQADRSRLARPRPRCETGRAGSDGLHVQDAGRLVLRHLHQLLRLLRIEPPPRVNEE
jgi:hypothetical protein